MKIPIKVSKTNKKWWQKQLGQRYSRMDILSCFGENLRQIRKSQGWNDLRALESKSGIDHSLLWKYEHGLAQISLINLIKLSKALDISLDELCGV